MWKQGIYLKVLGIYVNVTSWISADRVILIYDAIFIEKLNLNVR